MIIKIFLLNASLQSLEMQNNFSHDFLLSFVLATSSNKQSCEITSPYAAAASKQTRMKLFYN